MMKKGNIIIQLLVIVAIVVVVNLISNQLYFRLDFTEDQRYTFSEATKEVLDELDGVVTIKAYFSDDLPAQLLKTKQDFMDQLVEYENQSGGNVVYEFISPNESEELEQEAQEQGVQPVMINVTESDKVQQMRAYLGAVLKMEDRTEVIPVIQPGAAMEYNLTTSIKKISIRDKPKIGLIQGYGAPPIQAYPQLLEEFSVLYDVEPLNIADTNTIPSYYRALIWMGVNDTINPVEFQKLDRYLAGGGGLLVGYSPVQGDLQQGMLMSGPTTGMRRWLANKGLDLQSNFVIDANCASVTVQQRQGFFTINSQVEFPYFPIVSEFEDHPITGGLESVVFQFASSISFNSADTSASQFPLILSSENSGVVQPPAYVDIQKKWTQNDFTADRQILAAALDGLGGGQGKLVLISNGSFCVNGMGQQPQRVNQDNVSLAANAVDWLSDDTGLINLRTKGITNRPIEQIEDSTKNLLKYGNVLAPILLILIYAFVRKSQNNRKRQRWMQGNYN
ncbi:MAG: GldG family protein [Bacteroidota bacterium]